MIIQNQRLCRSTSLRRWLVNDESDTDRCVLVFRYSNEIKDDLVLFDLLCVKPSKDQTKRILFLILLSIKVPKHIYSVSLSSFITLGVHMDLDAVYSTPLP